MAEMAGPMGAAPASRPARWPWVVLAAFFGVALVALGLVVINGERVLTQLPPMLAFTMFGVVGALIASRDRSNRIGLMLLAASFITASSFFAGEYFTWRVAAGHDGPDVVLAGFVNNFGWLFGVLPVLFLLPLLFPDGHLPSRRWRPMVWFVALLLALISIGFVFGQRRLTGSSDDLSIANPFYASWVGRIPGFDPLIAILFPGLFGLAIASLIMRYRRSSGIVRQQIRWVVYGLLVALVGILLSYPFSTGLANALLTGVAFLAFPVSIGIAILRYHLYDLDVVVKKTVLYATLALFATAVYVALVVGLGAWVGRGNSLLTLVAAVVVAATFQPMRARLSRVADRIVYGKRATPYEVLSAFGERLGETYGSEDVLPRMARVLGEGVGAARATVWLRVVDAMRPVATWTREGAEPDLPDSPRVDVEHRGEVLGALSVAMPASDPIDPMRERLVSDLAAQAGLVLSNVRLTEELRARLEDLKRAQKRLVSAQDEERRRLERNIHDGAQQQLVALSVKARLTRTLTERDPAKAAEMLGQIETETQQALEDLRDLARGIYPPLLADQGLEAAITAQVRRSPVPVEVSADGVGRYPQEVEAAVYFSVLEALQNVAKYAGAHRASVHLAREDGTVVFEVRDDGRGFDPDARGYGTGLQGIADRLGALDGRLSISSSPGAGTAVTGTIPSTPVGGAP